MSSLHLQPADILTDHSTVILYGAGNVGRLVHQILTGHGLTVRCFLDRQAQPGAQWQGTPIYRPDDNPITHEERTSLPVVISIFNRETDIPEIAGILVGLGYGPCVSFVDLHARFPHELGDHFWLTERHYWAAHASEIEEACALWADETSRYLYQAIIEFRRTGNYGLLPLPLDNKSQYFSDEIPGWLPIDTPLRFVDCGAYDGDTLARLSDAHLPTEAIAAFEPDWENFFRLAERARAFSPMPPQGIALWPCAVAARTQVMTFSTGKGEGSHLNPEGDIVVQCVALDDALHGFRPNFIKMDIEGAEMEALNGAHRLIAQDCPRLAVCVYHRPGDVWSIPLLLHNWQLGYRFHLRAHALNDFDLVLYAVPS